MDSDPTPTTHAELGELLAACASLLRETAGLVLSGAAPQRFDELRDARSHLEQALSILSPNGSQPVLGALASTLTERLMDGLDHEEGRVPVRRPLVRGAERAGFEGHSATVSLPDVLAFLKSQGKTGVLEAWGTNEVFQIELANGELVHASSDGSPRELLLGEILVSQGAIQRRRLESFLDHARRTGVRIGQALAEERLVTREALRRALEYQVQQLFHRLFQAGDAWFCFRDGASCSGADGVRLDVTQLLLESARTWDEAAAGVTRESPR